MIEKEVIIIGGGPAGASCAWGLKNSGIDYLLLDKVEFPRFKPCAGWVTPRVFEKLQIQPVDYPCTLAHFNHFEIAIKNIHFRMKTNQFAIRRIEFDKWLLDRVAGSISLHNVRNIVKENGRFIIDGQYSARVIVGAGGTHCPVRRTLFDVESIRSSGTLIVALEQEFAWDYTDDRCHLWFLQNGLPGYAWYVPKPNGFLNIGVGGSASGLKKRGDSLTRHWDLLIEKLDKKGLVALHTYKPVGHSYHLRAKSPILQRDNAFLVGDSLGLATLDMGEGIGPAIESGLRAAESICTRREYTIEGIPRYSFPSLAGWVK